ncbi:MAG: PKD domain-containing protein [Methanosarcinales archaeon]|nr:PKD domain-containing protein [Methanosarcinales archaeon]
MALNKKILIFAVMLTVLEFTSTGYASASPPAEEWNRTYEMSDITSVGSFQQTADSGYIIAGNTRSNAFVLKTGPTGSEQWNRTFDRTFSEYRFKSVLQTSDGGYLIAGSTSACWDNCPDDVWLIKMSPQGQEQWNLTLGGTGDEEMVFVRQTADGGYILIGNTDSHANSSDIWFVKIDSKGNMQWNNTIGGTKWDEARFISQVPGGYIIAGRTESYGAGSFDFWLVKTDTKGEEHWNNTYGGYYNDGADSIQQTRDGGYIIAGMTQSFGAGHNDFLLLKTDSNGTEQWYRTFGGGNHEFYPSVRLSPDGGYILGGRTWSFDDADYWLIKIDEDGNVQWDRTFGGSGLDSFQQTHDGGYMINGDLYDPSKIWLVQKALIKTDSNGNEQWDIKIEGDELDSVLQTGNGGYILAGTKDSKLLLVKLMAERPAPSAQFTYDPGYPGANQTITFDASASHDPYGNITYYQWNLGDGSYVNTTQTTVTHSYDEGGNYSVGLIVTGSNNDMSSITREIIVQQSATPIMRWDKTFGVQGDDNAYSLAHTSDGGYIIAGSSHYYIGEHWNLNTRLVKTDANGNMQWQRTIGSNNSYEAYSAIQISDGGYIIAGRTISNGSDNFDLLLVKTDAKGIEQWNRTFGGNDYDTASSVRQASDGGYIIAGRTTSFGAGSYDFWLVKTDSEGIEQWNRTFGGDSSDWLYSFQQTFDGGYILGGATRSFGTGSSDFWLVKTDNNGIELWNRTFGGVDNDRAYSVQQTSDGGFILAGVTRSLHWYDCWLVKTDNEGVEMWNRTIGPNEDNSPNSILQSPDGGYIIAGKTGSVNYGSYDMWLVSTDPDGYVQWEMTFGGTGQDDVARSVLLAPDGGLVVAGDKDWFTEQGTDFWLIKLGGIPAEPEGGNAPTDGEPVQTPDIPGFGAAVAVIGLLFWGNSLLRRRI